MTSCTRLTDSDINLIAELVKTKDDGSLNYKIRDAAENEKINELRELLKNPEADVGVLDWREYTIIQCAAIKNKK